MGELIQDNSNLCRDATRIADSGGEKREKVGRDVRHARQDAIGNRFPYVHSRLAVFQNRADELVCQKRA
jgi:hypothetical protein